MWTWCTRSCGSRLVSRSTGSRAGAARTCHRGAHLRGGSAQGFLPQAGPLRLYREPRGPGIRVDSGFEEGDAIGHYDPLIAKLIVQAEDRERAILRLRAALASFPILGVRTNVPYLLAVVEDDSFARGEIDTTWLDRHTAALVASLAAEQPSPAARAAASHALERAQRVPHATSTADPWTTLGAWRLGS